MSDDEVSLNEFRKTVTDAFGIPRSMLADDSQAMKDRASVARHLEYLEKMMNKEDMVGCASWKKLADDLLVALEQAFAKLPGATKWVPKKDRIKSSMSQARRCQLGRHAERMAARFDERSRLHKKWIRLAARCGAIVRGTAHITPLRPAELITVSFKLDDAATFDYPNANGRLYEPTALPKGIPDFYRHAEPSLSRLITPE